MAYKPLNRKCFGSIPHLPGSFIDKTIRYISDGQAKIATIKLRDNWDTVIITEKLDGFNCGICKVNGIIFPITRSGRLACQSFFKHHQIFYIWAMERVDQFADILHEGECLVGENLMLAHGTKYTILSNEEIFRPFTLMAGNKHLCYEELMNRVAGKFQTVPLLSYGPPHTPEWCQDHFPISGAGAEQVEGYVYRIERKGKVDFLAKWVRSDYIPGKYLSEISGQPPIWNWYK